MLFANDARYYPFKILECVETETCFSAFAVRIASMIFRTARLLCVIYAEICAKATPGFLSGSFRLCRQDVAARRELSFSSTGEQDTTATHNASERAVHQPAPLNSSGLGSAFRPVQRSLGEARPLCSFVSQQDTSISSSRGGVAHGEDNESRTGAGTSGYAAPTHVTSGQPVRTPDSQLLQRDVTISRELLAASSAAALSVHSPDGRNESNSSWLCGPSPTVNTRQAMAEVMAMFNNPLEADDAGISELDKEFEDQFDNPGEPLSGLGGATKPRGERHAGCHCVQSQAGFIFSLAFFLLIFSSPIFVSFFFPCFILLFY